MDIILIYSLQSLQSVNSLENLIAFVFQVNTDCLQYFQVVITN